MSQELVHKPGKFVGKTRGERGEIISVDCCVSDQGQSLPPMIVFKGERIRQGRIGNAQTGTLFVCSKKHLLIEIYSTCGLKGHFSPTFQLPAQ